METVVGDSKTDKDVRGKKRRSLSRKSKKSARSNRNIAELCGRLLGEQVKSMQYPGGRSRRSFRLLLKEKESVIVSIRSERYRARTECKVLTELSSRGAPVPKLLANDGRKLLIQEEIVGVRLAESMSEQNEARVEAVLDAALTSLAHTHRAGSEAGFDTRLAKLGGNFDWLVGLLDRPAVIGNVLDVPAPTPNLTQLESLLAVRSPRFIKWDSRPGNAMVNNDGTVFWFDWEHCGTRNRLDDMAWLLADEYVPDYPAAEERLIDKHIHFFADDLSIDEAKDYLSAYGVFHMCVRLGLICKYKMQGDWWNQDYCMSRDKIGITWECMRRICRRGERWAKRNPHTEPLARWFSAICHRFEIDMLEESVHTR